MLSPFYKTVVNQISNFFQKEAASGNVNRYYLSLPSIEYVKSIVEALIELPEAKDFSYQATENSTPYKTIALHYGDYKYVIASTLNNTHIDYLVKMRNEMSEQKGLWENTSLLMISESMMDSIRGGSQSLTSEGLPLHVSQIIGNLEGLVKKCQLPNEDKAVLKHYLKRRDDLHYVDNSSFLDFEDVLTWINRDKMLAEDYKSIGYFKDNKLAELVNEKQDLTLTVGQQNRLQKEIDKRLQQNLDTFENIARIRELGDAEDRLVDMYDDLGKKLFKDEEMIQFEDVIKAKESVEKQKQIEFKEDQVTISVVTGEVEQRLDSYWMKSSKKRNWDLLIFCPNLQYNEILKVTLPFSQNTSKAYLASKNTTFVKTKGHSLVAEIPLTANNIFKTISYKHENMSSSKYTFKVLIIKDEETWYQLHKETFSITSKGLLSLELQDDQLTFGDGNQDLVVEAIDDQLKISESGATIRFNAGLLDEETNKLSFELQKEDYKIKIEIDDNALKAVPLTVSKIWQMKVENKKSFHYLDGGERISLNDKPYVTHEKERQFLKSEAEWLEHKLLAATWNVNTVVERELSIPTNLKNVYYKYLEVLAQSETIPSLLYMDKDIKDAAKEYVEEYMKCIEDIKDNAIMSDEQRNLLYLGTLEVENAIYMTPFSPLNVVYQLQIMNEVGEDSIDTNILKQLNAAFMLPYLVAPNDEVYKPDSSNTLPEWHEYRPKKQVSIGETNNYLAQVIKDKIIQFKDYYDYLFSLSSTPTLLINVININNDREVLKGILDWFKNEINKKNSLSKLCDVKVTSYFESMDFISSFEIFNAIDDPRVVKETFGFDCNTKLFDSVDVLTVIQKHLSYSKRTMDESISYGHISFYKMKNAEHMAKQIVTQAPNALNLGGLYVNTGSQRTDAGGYRVGFGTGSSDTNRTPLTRFAKLINELSANHTNYGQDPYKKENVFSLHINKDDENYLNELYKSCVWLTFIDPSVDLEYFQDTSQELVIVHYSDQLSSNNHYDAITVTDKSKQYFKVIDDFLRSQGIIVSQQNIESVIKAFNTFNGEWLLRAVQNRAHDKREKISIVSAIKNALIYLDRPTITWVPVSMEEIVRVAGNVRLSKKDGLFSGKTVGRKGNCSDDLLLIGIEKVEDKLQMYLYPIEVKIGYNQGNVIEKAISQVTELYDRLQTYLVTENNFDAKFLRNFFGRMFLNNAKKMQINQFWPEQNYVIDEATSEKLLNDEFVISNELKADFGIGMIMSFKKDLIDKVEHRQSGIIIYEIPETIAYKTLGVSMEKLKSNDYSEVSYIEVPVEKTISEEFVTVPSDINLEEIPPKEETSEKQDSENPETTVGEDKRKLPKVADNLTAQHPNAVADSMSKYTPENITENIRPLFGNDSAGKPVFWEFGKKRLSNRHMVIGGRSGQGKTYFIQSMLKQLSESGQSALVIDYSASYTFSQLDPVFLNSLGDKIQQRIVYNEGLPINPFICREKNISGTPMKEKVVDIASRVQGVFSSVYKDFGPQQESAIYRAAKRCLEMYGDKANMTLLLETLQELPNVTPSVVSSVTSKLALFVDLNPFNVEDSFSWDDYFKQDGVITIIQFEGFEQDDVKKLMTEFLLWDLWYYSLNGSDNSPIPVVLDEAQNLDFGSGTPSDKILREGRKFGISVWFATQTFSNFNQAELTTLENAATSVFFKPAESELKLIQNKLNIKDNVVLRTLQKGECIISGQFMENGELSISKVKKVKVPSLVSSSNSLPVE